MVVDENRSGTTVAHFEILEKIGKGGMGVVCSARDTKLDGLVALRLLPAVSLTRNVEVQTP